MSVKELMEIELFKLIKSRYVFGVLPVLLIPLLTAITVYINPQDFTGPLNQSALLWLNGQLFGANGFFLAPVTFLAISSGFLAKEIENKSIYLYIPRINNRKALYQAKIIAIIIFSTFIYLLASIIIVISYYTLVKGTPVGTGEFFGSHYVLENILNILISYLYNCVIITSVGMGVSQYLKTIPTIAILSLMGVMAQFLLIQSRSFITQFFPWNHMVILINKIDMVNPAISDYLMLRGVLLKNLMLTVIYSGIAYVVGLKRFNKRGL